MKSQVGPKYIHPNVGWADAVTCQHGGDDDHLADAVVLAGGQQRLGHLGLQGELGHDDAHLRQVPLVIQGGQVVQLLQCLHQSRGV